MGLQYRHSDVQMLMCNDLATLFVNLVNFHSVTLEFKIGKHVHPVVVSFFKIDISDKLLSQDPQDRCSPYFHRGIGI